MWSCIPTALTAILLLASHASASPLNKKAAPAINFETYPVAPVVPVPIFKATPATTYPPIATHATATAVPFFASTFRAVPMLELMASPSLPTPVTSVTSTFKIPTPSSIPAGVFFSACGSGTAAGTGTAFFPRPTGGPCRHGTAGLYPTANRPDLLRETRTGSHSPCPKPTPVVQQM